ncbi:PREDICTED: trichohyalin-like [Nicrophorus vespilloides]|uniref:Trichohyalin-like n=1 Tax=Nicrophorus vespilloides TaxID=110193 RepID=A0ABM1M1Z8_NICVS|nr:PREDICTED: trichohyalin-like [Nicrophorus vespilloides]
MTFVICLIDIPPSSSFCKFSLRFEIMESRWYVPAGKVLEETRIEDRKHALHICKENWSNITVHLDRNRLIAEANEDEENKRKAMKEASDEMTKNWDNSVENLRKRKEEQRFMKFEAKEDKNMKRYLELQKMQAEERQIYVDAMRDKITMKKDYPKSLHTALGVSEMVYENDRHLELKEKIRDHFRMEEAKYAKKVKDDAAAEAFENAEKARKEAEKNKKYGKELMQQIEGNRLEKERMRQATIDRELDDYDRRAKEMAQIEKYKEDTRLSNRKDAKRALTSNIEAQRKYRETMAAEDKQLDLIISIIDSSKKKIECMKKNKEHEMMEKRLDAAQRIAKLASEDQFERQMKEEASLKKAIDEREEQYWKKVAHDKEKKERAKNDLIESRKEWLEREEHRKCNEQELSKWEMLNRCKIVEEEIKHKEQLEAERREEMDLRRKELEEQLAENEKDLKAARVSKRKEYEESLDKFKEEDDEFFKYANELLENTKNRGRIIYPIQKVIHSYKTNMLGHKIPSRPCGNCKSLGHPSGLLNAKPGRMCHDPKSDPTYLKKTCKCVCHKDVLFK